jgi:ribbon-helix-helix CopG family protein
MSATRTQVYLTEAQRRRIDEVARADGVTLAEVIRRALDRYLLDEHVDPTVALDSTFGAYPDAKAPHRDEWGRG